MQFMIASTDSFGNWWLRMNLKTDVLTLRLKHPFRTARSVADPTRQVVHVHIGEGVGESAPTPYYGETIRTVQAALERYAAVLADLPDDAPIETVARLLKETLGGNPSARAAIECALWDALGKRLNAPLWKLWGLDPENVPPTSYTIGLDTIPVMQEKARQASPYAILKVKLGSPNDLDILRALRDVTAKPIRVDANTAWTPKDAIRLCERLVEFGVEFVEQPVKGDDTAGLRFVRERSPLPIIADESVKTTAEIPRLAECADGINIKLAKCGGLTEALTMIRLARVYQLKVMVGCMIETSVGISSMAQVTPLVDYADLDGHLLIENDLYEGVRFSNGRLTLTEIAGHGAQPCFSDMVP